MHYVSGKFRVFYTVDGKSAVPAADRDSSGVPDHIECFRRPRVFPSHSVCIDLF
jgi:hypothetical protein